ncbi:TspO/MBR-related protein [Botryosphaeria dothidea]|uniref:TspO/MBR-related protein n=1 Tax=Botryosphaeria dothidea TaxID=55169 RepID=A0A8H4IXH1_9PEZI|nr:TspO/MBR-related protein [Botryosphaeria dothidea]
MTTFIPALTLPSAVFETPAVAVLLPVVAGTGIGFSLRTETASLYKKLKQPPGGPPAYLFGPVWTLLYAGMGYASYPRDPTNINCLATQQGATLYTVQLGLNLIWTPLFFGLGRPIEAIADIVALNGIVGYLAYTWNQVDQTSAWLLAPYMAWLSFATYLSIGFGYLNNWSFKNIDRSDKSE